MLNKRYVFDGQSRPHEQRTDEAPSVIIKSEEKWYNQMPNNVEVKLPQPSELVQSLRAEAQIFLNVDVMHHKKKQAANNNRDVLWVNRILHTGTLADKVSAYNLLIQNSPVHNLHNVETLINMVSIKGKRECLMAIDALNDLFVGVLLAENRKLKQFSEQPLTRLDELTSNNKTSRKRLLILWLFEDKLKAIYLNFLKSLDAIGRDSIEKTKHKAVTAMYNLLNSNPEQDTFIIEQLVNKIGDPIAKIASLVCHLLEKFSDFHRNMTCAVMEEVERLLFRPNVPERTKYYCLCFLSRILLSREDYELANRMIKIYFGQFKVCIHKGEVNTKTMKVLLTGVSRMFPFSKLKNNVLMEQLETMYRLVHIVDFTIGVQALMLIFQVLNSTNSLSERFYSSLYRKLLDPAIKTSTRQASLLNLVYRCLKCDTSTVRVKSFVKRLLQVALYQGPNLQSGILIMISELSKVHPDIMKDAFKLLPLYDDDSDEHYEDAFDEDDIKKEDMKPVLDSKSSITNSWIHTPQRKKEVKKYYDPHVRNPLYSGSEFTNLWELLYMRKNFHPAVACFANQVFNSQIIKYQGDPLLDFTTSKFLERFVYKNPKKLPESSKTSTHMKVFGIRTVLSQDTNKVPVNNPAFLEQELEKVPVEERFIYQYLKKRGPSRKNKRADSDVESVCSDDFDNYINNIRFEDEGKKSLNFAQQLQLDKKNNLQKKKGGSDSGDDSDFGSLGNDSEFEDELDFDNDEELNKAFDEIDAEMPELDKEEMLNENLDEDLDSFHPRKKKMKTQKNYGSDIFADADEFSALLEDNAGSKIDTTTANALCNKDKADAKQLTWEIQRDQFVRGTDWKTRRREGRLKNKRGFWKQKKGHKGGSKK